MVGHPGTPDLDPPTETQEVGAAHGEWAEPDLLMMIIRRGTTSSAPRTIETVQTREREASREIAVVRALLFRLLAGANCLACSPSESI
jgi:hypothetical protein